MDKIQRAWERFVQNGTGSNAVREIVAASWKRSQGYHIPIERGEAPLAAEAEAVRLRSEHAALITAARPAAGSGAFPPRSSEFHYHPHRSIRSRY